MARFEGSGPVIPTGAKFVGGCLGIIVIVLFVIAMAVPGIVDFYYVDSTQIGVVTEYGKFTGVVGPGQQFVLFSPGYAITPVNVENRPFSFVIPQVALAGIEGLDGGSGNIQQQVTITVAGTMRNPTEITEDMWQKNRSIYLGIEPGGVREQEMSKVVTQAVRVCTGDKTLTEVVVGQRNDIAGCYNQTVQPLASQYGISITVSSVPDVDPPQSVLDSIETQSVLKQAAAQEEAQQEKDAAEAARLQAQQRNIAQSTAVYNSSQAEARITQAAANENVLLAEQRVAQVAATSTAQALNFGQTQEIIQLEIKRLQTEGEALQQKRLAELYQQYPEYAEVIIQQAFASALSATDKVFYIPPGTNAINLIGGRMYDQNGNTVPVIVNNNPVATPES